MNINIKEEVIFIKSQTLYIIAFSIFFFFSVYSVEFSIRKYFYYLNYLIVALSILIFSLYTLHVFISWIFEELNFAQRSIIYSLVTTIGVSLVLSFINSEAPVYAIVLLGFLYFVFIEIPRLAIVYALDSMKTDFHFVIIISRYYKILVALYIILTASIIFQYWHDSTLNMYLLLTVSNIIFATSMAFFAWRLKSKTTINKFKSIIMILCAIILNMVLIKYALNTVH